MKVAINKCYGGFSLSAQAVKRMAEIKGRPCYFYETHPTMRLLDGLPSKDWMWVAFDVPNFADIWESYAECPEGMDRIEHNKKNNAIWHEHEIESRPRDRSDAALVQTIEELGEEANGSCAKLAIVEIPDGIEYEVSEYDGLEHIAEAHRTWA